MSRLSFIDRLFGLLFLSGYLYWVLMSTFICLHSDSKLAGELIGASLATRFFSGTGLLAICFMVFFSVMQTASFIRSLWSRQLSQKEVFKLIDALILSGIALSPLFFYRSHHFFNSCDSSFVLFGASLFVIFSLKKIHMVYERWIGETSCAVM
ncbi:TPA: hypothetical protein P5J50_001869 [Legionella pneumophila]|nr:hypothetical protein [Legionella pneumophila]HDO7884568.1 hypothetical protein [Legionella pneumophila]HDO8047239.1 hypothetical protein [Legionella pneumophila]HDO8055420.1 hypothetical protein [Legionella pneumophila]HDO8149318.1 hypothetical protein [Legionella pneumophila]